MSEVILLVLFLLPFFLIVIFSASDTKPVKKLLSMLGFKRKLGKGLRTSWTSVDRLMAERSGLRNRLRGKVQPIEVLVDAMAKSDEFWKMTPIYELSLTGQLPDGRWLEASAIEPVPTPAVAQLQVGSRLMALVDPQDPSKVVIEW